MERGFEVLRFLSYTENDNLNPDECWVWVGDENSTGYGRFPRDNKKFLAHRVSYELFHGAIPNGLNVCHRCDNRLCVNPLHLWAGSQSENMRDAVFKGRAFQPNTSGEKNGNTKLTASEVQSIRSMHKAGVRRFRLAKIFGVSNGTIGNIINYETWKDVA